LIRIKFYGGIAQFALR